MRRRCAHARLAWESAAKTGGAERPEPRTGRAGKRGKIRDPIGGQMKDLSRSAPSKTRQRGEPRKVAGCDSMGGARFAAPLLIPSYRAGRPACYEEINNDIIGT